ncbi:MAG: hypothetical protein ACW96S_02705 [Promethearchaeota archaeon]|jgi:hypothetical protein
MRFKKLFEYSWILPYIGGVLAIISVITPASAQSEPDVFIDSHTYWLWGLVAITDWTWGMTGWAWENTYQFITNPLVLSVNVVLTLMVIIVSVKLLFKTRSYVLEKKNLDKTYLLYSACYFGIITAWLIINELIYSVTGFLEMGPYFSFIGYFGMEFGVYGLYLGGAVTTLGYILTMIGRHSFYY